MARKTFEYKGDYHTISELAAIGGHTYETMRSRLERGWDVELAVETPLEPVLPPQEYQTCESGSLFLISISEPIPSVFKEMQPKLHRFYQATVRGGEYARSAKRFFIIQLEDGRPLIVYPEECNTIKRYVGAS